MYQDANTSGDAVVIKRKPWNKRMLMSAIFSLLAACAVISLLLTRASMTVHAASASYVPSGDGTQKSITTTVTWYGYDDNSGETENQYGSADIAYPKSDGYPTLHDHATEAGRGTYSNPVTFAAPNKDLKSSFPIGSVIYVPMVQKYFIMEDECGDDDPTGCQNGTNHADLWMGPAQAVNADDLSACEDKATPDAAVKVIINPSPSLTVTTNIMYTSTDECNIKLYS